MLIPKLLQPPFLQKPFVCKGKQPTWGISVKALFYKDKKRKSIDELHHYKQEASSLLNNIRKHATTLNTQSHE